MSHEKNFVSELVQMARAFEELPVVQADLMTAKNDIAAKAEAIQRLELRLIDAKNELDAAHAATVKAVVERDHAETMFLETDQKLDGMRAIFSHFKNEVNTYIEATSPEPVKPAEPEPTAQPKAEQTPGQFYGDPQTDLFGWQKAEVHEVTDAKPADVPATMEEALADPTKRHDMFQEDVYYQKQDGQPVPTSSEPQATSTDTVSNTTSPGEAGSSGNTDSGQSAADPISALPDPIGTGTGNEVLSSEGVSVSPDPITSGVETTQSGPTSDASDQTAQPDTAAAIVTSEPTPQDDVGYHNEPQADVEGGYERWLDWYTSMNNRYGAGLWPARPPAA